MVHVSYNGGLAALNGLATGQVSLMFAALPLALPYLGNEHFSPWASPVPSGSSCFPSCRRWPKRARPDSRSKHGYGIFAPSRTPPAARVWLTEQIGVYMASDSARMRLIELGLNPATATVAQFATRIHSETDKWGPVLRASRTPSRARRKAEG